MKTILFGAAAIALSSVLAMPACAQPAPSATATVPADADPALWIVKDEDTTIYLFGTIHVLKPGLTWFDEAVKTAFDKSDTLVLEMVEPDQATMQKLVMSKAMAAPGEPPLTQQVPEAKRAAFTKAITDAGLPAAAVDRFKPWFASVMFAISMISKAGYNPDQGSEKVLSAAAKSAGKPVSGVETAEQQLGFFDGLSREAQLRFLNSMLDDLPKGVTMIDSMVVDWSEGDPDALAVTMNESLKDSPEVAKALLYDRNARWAGWIAERMKTPGTVFMAVGAGHLAGDQSVQAKLAPMKIKAERVKY